MGKATGLRRRERRVRRTGAHLGLAALAATWLLVASAPASAGADECAGADALLDAGTLAQVEEAQTTYQRILATTPDSSCATTGEKVAVDLITAADLHGGGLDSPVPGYVADAIKLRPQTRLPAELQGPHRSPWQSEPWLNAQDRIVIAVLLLVLVGLTRAMLTWLKEWQRGRLLIGSFVCGDDNVAAGFAAVVGDHVQRLGDFRTGQRPDRVSKWGDPVALPAELSTAMPPAGLVNALLGVTSRLVPSRDRSLGGTLHVAGSCVVGASLTLETRQSRVVDGCGIWATSYALTPPQEAQPRPAGDRPELLYPLAFPVAVWAFWQLTPDAWRLGTRSWQSYALFGMGEDFDANAQIEQAERCYLRALACDPENAPARLNLAGMWLMAVSGATTSEANAVLCDGDAGAWAERELLRIGADARDARESPAGGREPDANWYRAQYVLTATAARHQLEVWCDGGRPGPWGPAGQAAVERSEDLVRQLERALGERPPASRLPGSRRGSGDSFYSFLEDIEAAALILWAGVDMVRRLAEPEPPARPALTLGLDGPVLSRESVLAACDSGRVSMPARARYNLACYHAVAAMVGRGEREREHRNTALLQLQLAMPSLPRSTLVHAYDDICFRELRTDPRFGRIVGEPAALTDGEASPPGRPPAARTSAGSRSPR